MHAPASLFDRWIARPRKRWPGWAICVGLLCLPKVISVLQYGPSEALGQPGLRGLLIAPAVIAYIFFVSPLLTRIADEVFVGLRPLLDVDKAGTRDLLNPAAAVRPARERQVIIGGALLGMLQVLASNGGLPDSWQEAYWLLTTAGLYALLGLVTLGSFAETRRIAALHRQIRRVDPLDPHPFDAVGRQGLVSALAFIGGISVSLLLMSEAIRRPEFWVVYVPLVTVPVAIFFLNMRPTHALLSRCKRQELRHVAQQVNAGSRRLNDRLAKGQPTGSLAADIGALMAFERRLESARTWPDDTAMLRTLGLSVLVPLATVVIRSAIDRLFG
jgi:hypothetical protein